MNDPSAGTVDATFYAQVEPEFYHLSYGESMVRGAKVARVTQTRPDKPKPGVVLVKLTLRMPKRVFLPLAPEAVVVIPDNYTEVIEVHAEDPIDYLPEPLAITEN